MIIALIGKVNKELINYIKVYYENEGLLVKEIDVKFLSKEFLNNLFDIPEEIKKKPNYQIQIETIKEIKDDYNIIYKKELNLNTIVEKFLSNKENIYFLNNIILSEIDASTDEIKLIYNINTQILKTLKNNLNNDIIVINFKEENELSTILADYEVNISVKEDVEIFTKINNILNSPNMSLELKETKLLTNLNKYIPLKKEEVKVLSEKKRKINSIKKYNNSFNEFIESFIKDLKEKYNIKYEDLIKYIKYFLYKFIKCKKEGLSYKSVMLNCFALSEADFGFLNYIFVFKLNKAIELFLEQNEISFSEIENNIDINIEENFNKKERIEKLYLFYVIMNEINNNEKIKDLLDQNLKIIINIYYSL